MLFIYHILTSEGGLVHCFVTASPKIYHSAINQYFYGNITVEHADIRTEKQTKIDPCNTDDKQKKYCSPYRQANKKPTEKTVGRFCY